jgi:acetylornithine deacetylase
VTSPDQSALTARIAAAVDTERDRAIADLQALVRVPSLTGEEGAVQAVVATLMERDGLDVDTWVPDAAELAPYADHVGAFDTLAGRPNVVGTRKGAGDGRSLILNAHIDTVETGDPARWTYPPFSGELVDGQIYGRGALDMKGGLITNLTAFRALRNAGLTPQGDIHVESVISEEDGGAGALATILRGYKADAAVITEPTLLETVIAQGGSLVFRLHIEGRSAHAAVRDDGVSAIEKFPLLHRALLDFEAERNRTLDHPLYAHIANKIPINIGTIRGGSWPSSVPEWLYAEGRAGLVPGEDVDAFKADLVHVIDHAAQSDPWLREHPPRIEWFSGQFAPAEIPGDHPLVGAVRSAHHAVTGQESATKAVTYGADMRHFRLFGNMPCLMYGAGDVRWAHYTDEHIAIADILTAAKTIAHTIAFWCGVTDTPR